jgi:hypothetical protein
MPKEMQKSRCKRSVGTVRMDYSGELEDPFLASHTYQRGWTEERYQVCIPGVHDCYYKFA